MSNVIVPVGKAAWECKPENPSSRELTKDAKLWAQRGAGRRWAQYSPPLLQVITYRGASVPHRNSHMYWIISCFLKQWRVVSQSESNCLTAGDYFCFFLVNSIPPIILFFPKMSLVSIFITSLSLFNSSLFSRNILSNNVLALIFNFSVHTRSRFWRTKFSRHMLFEFLKTSTSSHIMSKNLFPSKPEVDFQWQ